MSLVEIFIIVVALSIDAFSVSFGVGCKYHTPRHYFRLGWHFGLFQFLMPLIGAFIGYKVQKFVNNLDIIAAIILFVIAYKMIKEAMENKGEVCNINDPTKGLSLVSLSLATSMDALGVGFTFVLFKGNIFVASLLIGFVCAIFSLVGVYLGSISKRFFGEKIEILGAIVLFFIGIKFFMV
ncbi:manganese efflux pump [Deferribacter autotrophicus]|uniref:Putative manganese efflux pump MntP n=1 Tax=Deferribacter autotrophicus TaxID=500465 RepID=A0A5A8F0Y9_9BACT|nr:manganese efflux pump MntP family protein [Deferribacter autotrophicus]KAA0257319.1 manganese efflux pump [Deferribacter autotrophicus]